MIVVLMPTRGRPAEAGEAARSAYETATGPIRVVRVLDSADKQLKKYQPSDDNTIVCEGNMIQRTNFAAMKIVDDEAVEAIGWMADDNRFKTDDWDGAVRKRISEGWGFVALNDLFWSEKKKPVNIFTRPEVIKSLGWFANPYQHHHYMDDTWRVLGISTDSWVYLPDVICEHLHPAIGKNVWNDSYNEHEGTEFYAAEGRRFIDWVQTGFDSDREKVKEALRETH